MIKNDNMNELFIKYVYSNKKLVNGLLKNLVKIKNVEMKIKYIINSVSHIKINQKYLHPRLNHPHHKQKLFLIIA